jgi:hypothetical protein
MGREVGNEKGGVGHQVGAGCLYSLRYLKGVSSRKLSLSRLLRIHEGRS